MYWSTDDHHRQQQQHNYYNSLQQSVQHQNGLQQATAAVPPHQQQHATQPHTIQQHQHQQQQHQPQPQQQPQQQQQHRSAQQQIQSHFVNQQQFQQQHPQQQQHHHPHQQWSPRPAPILTVPPFIPQYSNTVPSTTQFCAPPPNYYPPPQQQYTQASAVSAAAAAAAAASQQRQCLPQGCTVYSMPPPATALRQNVITQQPPPNILTPTTSAAQQMQVQYFSSPQFCQPPPLGQQTYGGHIMTQQTLADQQVVKPRKYAIPIIDPITNENVLERKSRSNESPDADSVSLITTTPSSTSIDEFKESINYVKEEYQAIEQLLPEQEEKMTLEEEYVKDDTDASSPAVLDHVGAIEPEEDAGYFEGSVKNSTTPPPPMSHEEEIDQTTQDTTPITITNDKAEVEKKNSSVDDDDDAEPSSSIQGNMCATPPPSIGEEEDKSALQIESEDNHPESAPKEVAASPSDAKATAAVAGKLNKKQQTPPPASVDDTTTTLTQPPPPTPPTTTTTATKLPSKKAKRNSKRLKESQKKQKADLIKSENNNTNKATNQNENNKAKQKEKLSDPSNSSIATATTTSRLKTKAKETTKSRSNSSTKTEASTATPADIEAENTIAASLITATTAAAAAVEDVLAAVATTTTAATSVDVSDKSEESSLQVDDSTETLTNYDENDHSASLQLDDDSPKLSKSLEIKSKFLNIEPTSDDNELLFLNSSVSGYEEDISPSSTTKDNRKEEQIEGILFGDFSQTENFITDEAAVNEEGSELKAEEEEDINQIEANSVSDEFKEKKYTLEQLKSLAKEPASKVPPAFRGQICEKIGKNPRDGPAVQYQQIYQQMSYKDSINLNRKRNKRDMMPSPHQQFQQHHHYQQQQFDNQQQQQQQRNPDIIRVYLSLNEDIQLAESENAWVPPTLKNVGPKNAEDDETILKKIRGILNKLTPENFDKLLHNASMFPMDSVDRINKVMLLIFEKTLREPDFAPTYARFCKFLFNPEDSNKRLFKTILVTRIQEEFNSNVNNAKAKEAKLRPLMDKMAAATDPREKLEIKAEIDDQEYQFRRRAWGTVRFIAEMCKLDFISTTRACLCVENLLDVRCEEKLEYMCKLLSTVGPQLEWAHKDRGYDKKSEIKERLDKIFTKIRQVVEKKNGAGQKISSRVRFMMQDIMDLRARSWDVGKETAAANNVLPSREVSPAFTGGRQSSQQQQQQQQRGGGGGSRNFMPSMTGSGGYDNKKRQLGNEAQQKTTEIDRNKLSFNFNSEEIKLGPSVSMWQKSSKPKSSPVNVFHQPDRDRNREQNQPRLSSPTKQQDLSKGECECHLNRLIEMVAEGEEPSEWFKKWSSISKPHHACIIDYVLSTYLHSKECELDHCTKLFTSLFREKLITRQTFSEGYNKFSQFWDDTLMDMPKGWDVVFRFFSPLLHHELLAFDAIWDKKWFDTPCGCKFVKSMIEHFTSEFGANYMRYFWDNHVLEWSMFLPEDKIQSFITTNHFEFIENHKCVPPMFIHRTADQLVQRIKELLAQSSQGGIDLIIDFISTNVRIDCNFIRSLTMFLCDYTVIQISNKNSSNSTKSKSKSSSDTSSSPESPSYKIRQDVFVQKCIPLLRRCIDSNDEYELSCLNAIVAGCDNLDYDKFPTDLICSILFELYGEVISKESFDKWREQLAADVESNISKELDAFFKNLPI